MSEHQTLPSIGSTKAPPQRRTLQVPTIFQVKIHSLQELVLQVTQDLQVLRGSKVSRVFLGQPGIRQGSGNLLVSMVLGMLFCTKGPLITWAQSRIHLSGRYLQ